MGSSVSDREALPLEDLHTSRGLVGGEERGRRVPLHYGDPAAELEAAIRGCAVVDLSWCDRLELCGADCARLVNGLFSAEIQTLEAGQGRYGFFTDGAGRVLADAYVSALEDRLWLQLPARCAPRLKEHVEHYRVIEDVEVTLLHDMLDVAVLGARTVEILGGACELPGPDRIVRTRLAGSEIQLGHRRLHGVEAYVLWLPAAIAGELLDDLLDRSGVTLAGVTALETLRCRAGIGRWGVDFDERTVANETGLVEAAVDFTKGCYLGQEIVARIFYRGRPARECRQLIVRSDARPQPGPLEDGEGEVVGQVTSVAMVCGAAGWPAIGTVSRAALEAASHGGWLLDGAPVSLGEGG